jgi:hypothetical protein
MRWIVRLAAILLVVLGGALVLARPALAQGPECVRLGEDLIVAAGHSCSGDAVAIGGDLIVRGKVGGNAVAIGGSVWISGQVDGDVVSLGGEVLLRDGAQVAGDVSVLGGLLHLESGAVVQGNVLASGPVLSGWESVGDRPPASLWTHLAVAVLASALALGLCLLLAWALRSHWPRRTQAIVGTLRAQLLPSLGLGVASSLLLAVLLPVVALLLLLTFVGVVLIPVLGLLVGLLYLAGLTTSGLALGEVLQARTRASSVGLMTALGLAILVVLAVLPAVAIPWLGPAWAVLLASVGVGAIALSRVGTWGRPAGGSSG